IYAGPHSSFVPKNFRPYIGTMHAVAELGFILVQIDGLGTSNRSKAFHDVCWKNLKDAGFPDRIIWMKEAAKKYPYMDITRAGVFGTSAGGQNSAGAVLFHPDFYKVAVSSCGCHDNRMDKIWWNEQWMGWPVGPEYAASSNTENAYRLKGKLLLINGEMDANVDPASTVQFVNALIKANKDFDYLFVPGMGHSSGGDYGERRRRDYFVKHLLGVDPPDWNMMEK
ncbi:MAG: prolyl oligopeptidase family serine peptidase, partial [Bacteroidales bacterium]|nr:prolyl oligopeptidase family serine peptidase [Bacteroidales bacterium]